MSEWHLFEVMKPINKSVCAVIIKEELPFSDPVVNLFDQLVLWDGLNEKWVCSNGKTFECEVILWMFVQFGWKVGKRYE